VTDEELLRLLEELQLHWEKTQELAVEQQLHWEGSQQLAVEQQQHVDAFTTLNCAWLLDLQDDWFLRLKR
jgi:hypothetical protein